MSDSTDIIKRYASRLLLNWLKGHPEPLKEPIAECFPAAMLVTDITGFTKITEKLTRKNPQGIVELAELLDIYIGRLVEIIAEHGGDIVKFAGDALFAIWRAPEEEQLGDMVYRATRCGLKIKEQLVDFEAKEGLVMSLRVGLGAGQLHVLHVGGSFQRWELLFAGEAMNQVNQAGGIARSGEVVISPTIRHYLDQMGCGKRVENENRYSFTPRPDFPQNGKLPLPEISSEAEPALRAYVPRVILSRLDDGQDPRVADLRKISVMFLKVRSFSFTPKTPVSEVQGLMELMQDCLYKHEGSVNRFGIDDKGAVLLAAFGLPPLDHDDDALRAVLAAQELITEFNRRNQECVIGICTGRVFCGSVGSELRSDYTMHGSIVNMAASLMQASESILCDDATYEHAHHRVNFKELPPVMVKGRSEPQPVYQPLF